MRTIDTNSLLYRFNFWADETVTEVRTYREYIRLTAINIFFVSLLMCFGGAVIGGSINFILVFPQFSSLSALAFIIFSTVAIVYTGIGIKQLAVYLVNKISDEPIKFE